MAAESPRIFWREDEQTYLPQIDPLKIGELLTQELERHVKGVEAGLVVSSQDFYEKHIEKYRHGTETQYRKKAASAEVMVAYESLKIVNAALRQALGDWIPDGYVYITLLPKFQDELIAIGWERINEAKQILLEGLIARRQQVDQMLKDLDQQAKSIATTSNTIDQQAIRETLQMLTRQEIEQTDCEDRWFFDLEEKTALWITSLSGSPVFDEIEKIADRNFESWVAPSDDAIIRFADEIAAIGVKKRFEQAYGPEE
ncbi:hypothetical protein DTL21_10630 [Bremerella cremea]|uniref:Uncharacterized protein n=1 Tax=Blastopirellula marina TaxID=124 RepID=A0A2S8FWY0_9BACT|nr:MULTISPECIES: hypothetical protein [Pirellulaceae]PQO36344.1 hypothetical protein C5Y83_10625 [Blastopirellula marina]RCS49021.1 hypothetical protein DTL21_10630 [Bremerella cremea]